MHTLTDIFICGGRLEYKHCPLHTPFHTCCKQATLKKIYIKNRVADFRATEHLTLNTPFTRPLGPVDAVCQVPNIMTTSSHMKWLINLLQRSVPGCRKQTSLERSGEKISAISVYDCISDWLLCCCLFAKGPRMMHNSLGQCSHTAISASSLSTNFPQMSKVQPSLLVLAPLLKNDATKTQKSSLCDVTQATDATPIPLPGFVTTQAHDTTSRQPRCCPLPNTWKAKQSIRLSIFMRGRGLNTLVSEDHQRFIG